MAQKVRIVFRGEIVAGEAKAVVREHAAELLKASPQQIERIFSGVPVVLREELPEEEAPRYQSRLEKAGMRVYIERIEAEKTAPSSSQQHPVMVASPEVIEPVSPLSASVPDPVLVSTEPLVKPKAGRGLAKLKAYLGFPLPGRLKRLDYFIGVVLWFLVGKLLTSIFAGFLHIYIHPSVFVRSLLVYLMWATVIIAWLAYLRLSIPRCRDIGWSPVWVWLFLGILPIISGSILFSFGMFVRHLSFIFAPAWFILTLFQLCLHFWPSRKE